MQNEFDRVYFEALHEIAPLILTRHCEHVVLHNHGWSTRPEDVVSYLEASKLRYSVANDAIVAGRAKGPFVDIGGFWGVFPLALRKLGHEVAMTETLRFYDGAFNSVFDLLRSRGVKVHDVDPFTGEAPPQTTFGTGFCMAVLEHYPHSLAGFFRTVNALLRVDGMLYVEVPNLAHWCNRMSLLRGETILPSSDVVYRSGTPFTGHHREYTLADVSTVLSLGDWNVHRVHAYTYSTRFTWKSYIVDPLRTIAHALLPLTREVLAVECGRK